MNKINVVVPDLPESVSNATIVKWYKKIGDIVYCDDNIVDIETDKVTLEIASPCTGRLQAILEETGKLVISQQIIGQIIQSDYIQNNIVEKELSQKELSQKELSQKELSQKELSQKELSQKELSQKELSQKELSQKELSQKELSQKELSQKELSQKELSQHFTPSIRRLIKINYKNNNSLSPEIEIKKKEVNINISSEKDFNKKEKNNIERRVKMSRLRQKIAERLLYSKKNTAMLTTFNEVNMKPIILLRKKYNEAFKKEHGIRLGFMSFFVKAVVQSLKKFPEINASIDKDDIIYYKNFDISIAISTSRGLITPVLRNAENMSMSEIEKKIKEFSLKGSQNKIHITELIGGNFTITNGGIFGSLMSTPIINPPQTAILGMHTIQERPMVVNGEIIILPMMYLALSYDHRLIDGKESIGFLVSIKNILEDFTRILINI